MEQQYKKRSIPTALAPPDAGKAPFTGICRCRPRAIASQKSIVDTNAPDGGNRSIPLTLSLSPTGRRGRLDKVSGMAIRLIPEVAQGVVDASVPRPRGCGNDRPISGEMTMETVDIGIACIGTQGPAPIFSQIGLQQSTCTEGVCRIGREGAQLVILSPDYQTSIKGIYAIGGAISPAFIESQGEGSFKERKHANLIYTAVKDAVRAVDHIAAQLAS